MAVALAAARRVRKSAFLPDDDASTDASSPVPVGAALFSPSGEIMARSSNSGGFAGLRTHAETRVLVRALATSRSPRLPPGCSLYVTVEPCLGCLGSAALARVDRLVWAAASPKYGAFSAAALASAQPQGVHTLTCVQLPVSGAQAIEAAELMRGFFRERRSGRQPRKPAEAVSLCDVQNNCNN